jgi:SAM-dependent methyltransferase
VDSEVKEMMTHREYIKAYLGGLELDNVSVVDWGAGSKPVERYLGSEDCEFFKIDINDYNPQDLVADITLPIKLDKEYDYAFCMEVLEHIPEPDKVLQNIYNNLKTGGTFIYSVPFCFRLHADDDYWRFTINGARLLAERNGFTVKEILSTPNNNGFIIEVAK